MRKRCAWRFVDFRTSWRTCRTRRRPCWPSCVVSTRTCCRPAGATCAATTCRHTWIASCCPSCSTCASSPPPCVASRSPPSCADSGATSTRPPTSRTCSSRRVLLMTRSSLIGSRNPNAVQSLTTPPWRRSLVTNRQLTPSTSRHLPPFKPRSQLMNLTQVLNTCKLAGTFTSHELELSLIVASVRWIKNVHLFLDHPVYLIVRIKRGFTLYYGYLTYSLYFTLYQQIFAGENRVPWSRWWRHAGGHYSWPIDRRPTRSTFHSRLPRNLLRRLYVKSATPPLGIGLPRHPPCVCAMAPRWTQVTFSRRNPTQSSPTHGLTQPY